MLKGLSQDLGPPSVPGEGGVSPEEPQGEEAEWVGEDGLTGGQGEKRVSEHLVSGLGDVLFPLFS